MKAHASQAERRHTQHAHALSLQQAQSLPMLHESPAPAGGAANDPEAARAKAPGLESRQAS